MRPTTGGKIVKLGLSYRGGGAVNKADQRCIISWSMQECNSSATTVVVVQADAVQ